jgi:hypothetical protein
MDVLKMQVIRDENGNRKFLFVPTDEDQLPDFVIDVTLTDGERINRFNRVRSTDGDPATNPATFNDEQLKEFVINQHKHLNLQPSDITINRQEGKVEVEVNNGAGTELKMKFRVR